MRLSTLALVSPMLALVVLSQVESAVVTRDDLADEYYGESPPFSLEGRSWLALFVDEDSSWLEPAQPEWVGDGVGADRVFTLSTGPRTPILLVANVPQIAEGPASTVVRFTTILSESPLEMTLAGRTYTLTLISADPPECGGVVTVRDGDRSHEMYSTVGDVFSCDEPHFSVNWAGDLDRDAPPRLFVQIAVPILP